MLTVVLLPPVKEAIELEKESNMLKVPDPCRLIGEFGERALFPPACKMAFPEMIVDPL